ncbi:MAG: CDP-diacylglycerol--glycerol-3-phosphate 3-phosphatidyltransferase [Smithella sp. SDB]|nr:MAG: CDP-diacylglycerol--glycerol-3-phosphate 3-phosphatidyltransferase [Smithella sp. SDB]
MNIPNLLSLTRIILVPVFIIFLIQDKYYNALIVFIIAGLTDALDGTMARLLNAQTKLGSYLDPIADKLLLTTSFLILAILGIVPSWLTVIVISRDFMILLGIAILTLMSITFEIKPALIGKITTTLQIGTVFLVLLYKAFTQNLSYECILSVLFWLTAAFTVASGLVYIIRGVKIVNRTNIKDIEK